MPMKFNRKNVRKALEELGTEAWAAIRDAGLQHATVTNCQGKIGRATKKLIAALCPDKPAPKVYTEDELEPVGTVPVVGDRVILDFGKAGQYEKEVAGIESERMYEKEPKEDTLGWPRYCWECHAGFRPVRILKRPLRDVFKDPRVGDVVRLGFEVNKPYKILHVDENYVFAEDGLATWWFRAGWASLATSNHTVISRAESK